MSISSIEFIKPTRPVSPYDSEIYKTCKRASYYSLHGYGEPASAVETEEREKMTVSRPAFSKYASSGWQSFEENKVRQVNDFAADREIYGDGDVWLRGNVPFVSITNKPTKADRLILLSGMQVPKAALHARLVATCVLAYGAEYNDEPLIKSSLEGIVFSFGGVVLHRVMVTDRGGPSWDLAWEVARVTNDMAFLIEGEAPEPNPCIMCVGCPAKCEFAK